MRRARTSPFFMKGNDMQAMFFRQETVGEKHWCAYCSRIHDGLTTDIEYWYDTNNEDNTGYNTGEHTSEYAAEHYGCDENDLEERLYYQCKIGHMSSEEEEIYDLDGVWQCGECESQYPVRESAEECCL